MHNYTFWGVGRDVCTKLGMNWEEHVLRPQGMVWAMVNCCLHMAHAGF